MLERTVGEILTVSIGTAMALEKLMAEEKPIKYEYIFLNVRTLFRNFHDAFDNPDKHPSVDFRQEFYDELELIKSTIENGIKGNLIPVFYICSNKSMSKLFPVAKLKVATTNNQKNMEALERFVIENLMSIPFGKQIKVFDCLIKGNNSKSLIVTHFPFELLSHTTFRTLDLLESHTGTIKDRSLWNSKLTNPEAYRNLPFNILTIQVVGDAATQFNSLGIKFIKPLMEIAEKNKWSNATSIPKVKYDVEKYFDKFAANVFLEMLGTKLR